MPDALLLNPLWTAAPGRLSKEGADVNLKDSLESAAKYGVAVTLKPSEARALLNLIVAARDMLPLLEHAEACESNADDGLGERLRSLRRRVTAARDALAAMEKP